MQPTEPSLANTSMEKPRTSFLQKVRTKTVLIPFSIILFLVIVIAFSIIPFHHAIPGISLLTNSSWNSDKAAYLAQRVYLNPTMNEIAALSKANSAEDAVNMIFTSPGNQQEQQYQTGLQNLMQNKDKFKTQTAYENTLYAYQMVYDPDRVRRNLYYLLENIFSVDAPDKGKKITLDDGIAFHQMLYNDAFGNYIQLVKNVETSYAMAQYLDLTASTAKNPNENFSREVMQLFLIGPYTPLDHNRTTPNYSEQDVNSLAYILSGYTTDKINHTVSFNPRRHYQGTKLFLGEQYNDPQGAIDYIVQQRQMQAGEFLANKLLHYYVSDTPSDQDITTFAHVIIQNNFAIEPSLKWLFASDIMYRPEYMNEYRFKTPMSLISSYYSILFGLNNDTVIPTAQELNDLDFTPYHPGSIFGRDGFNKNILFYSGTIMNRWIADTDKNLHTLGSKNLSMLSSNLIPNPNSIQTPDDLINTLSQELYLGKTLPVAVQETLKTYLTTNDAGNPIPFALSNQQYIRSKLPGLISYMLVQPEFLTQSGNLQATALPPVTQVNGGNNSKLIVIRVRGGWDFQGIWANISDPAYAMNRKQMALNASNSTPLGSGYVLSNAASSLLPLIKSKEAFLVSSVGLPNHSRAHDIAGIQMETGLDPNENGILGQLNNALPSINLISLTNTPPLMLNGAQSLQIGSSSLTLYQIGKKQAVNKKTLAVRENDLKQTFTNRLFPKPLALYYTQALLLDHLAAEDIAQGGKGTPGGTNATQFPFLEKLITDDIGNTYYLYADDSYDHHAHEDLLLNNQIKDLMNNVVNFYNDEKNQTKLTIVIFSEFGRTDKINGSNGTDHGEGGGMVILSNVVHLPTMVGTITPSKDVNNWSTVQVDERDVWSTLFSDIYGLPQDKLFGRNTPLNSYPVAIQ